MKIRVSKATLQSYWYVNKVGREFEVEPNEKSSGFDFKVVGDSKHFNKDDVEIIKGQKGMKKSELKTGMRVVHGKHPQRKLEVGIIVKDLDRIMFPDGGWNSLSGYDNDLTSSGVWDITEIYACPENSILDFNNKPKYPLWRRELKTAEEKQLDIVMEKIAELQTQASELQKLVSK